MARPPKLNWDAARGKWRVVYQGKKYRFDGGSGKSDREARKRADVAWKQLKTKLDHQSEQAKPHRVEYENVIGEWESVLTWAVDHDDDTTAAVARDKIRDLQERLSERLPPPLGWSDRFFAGPEPIAEVNTRMEPVYRTAGLEPAQVVTGPVPFDQTLWHDRLAAQDRRLEDTETDDTFATTVDQFLQQKRTKVAAGQLSPARVESLRAHLEVVMKFSGRSTAVSRINHDTVQGFYQHLLERVAAKQMGDHHAHDVFVVFKQFVRWLAKNTSHLETLPKNIDDRELRISVGQRDVATLSREQVKSLLDNAEPRTRLYCLLGLNTAMTQQDMADLAPSEVDWENGCIIRKRSKTKRHDEVPIVRYQLWPATLALLQQERSDDSSRVLLTRDGRPLKTEVIQDNGKLKKTDVVRLAINRLAKKSEIKFTLKTLKKTSASLLRGHRSFQGLESLFLGHADRSIAHRHYTQAPQDLLDEAILWLGQELGIVAADYDGTPTRMN